MKIKEKKGYQNLFYFKIIKIFHYISLICVEKILKCINESNIFDAHYFSDFSIAS